MAVKGFKNAAEKCTICLHRGTMRTMNEVIRLDLEKREPGKSFILLAGGHGNAPSRPG